MNKLLLPAALLLSLAPAALAQDAEKPGLPEEVKVWVDKIDKLVGQPAEYDLSMKVDMVAQGQKLKMDNTGHIMMLDAQHMRATMNMKLTMAPMDPMDMTLKMVSDGQTLWIESDNPMMGKQVMKADIKHMEKLQQSGMGMGPGSGMNQLEQVRDLFENYYHNFKVVEADGKVEITGDISQEILESQDYAEMELKHFRMVLDAKTGFPLETAMNDGTKDVVLIGMSNLKFLKKEDIPEDAFAYTPPEGVNVMDIGAMLGGGMSSDDGF